MLTNVIAPLLAIAVTVPASAQTTLPASVPAAPAGSAALVTPATSGADDRMICRREEVIGSRLGGHKECHTKMEWRKLTEENRRMFDQYNRQLGSGSH